MICRYKNAGVREYWIVDPRRSPVAEYVVFEHGAFDYENQNCGVEEKIEKAMASFDYSEHGYQLDTSTGRVSL